jgi:hypothetical protein
VRSEARCLHQPFDIALARMRQSAIGRSSSWAFLSIQRSTCSPVHPRSRFAPPAYFITHPTMSLPRQAELLPAPTLAHGTATSSRQPSTNKPAPRCPKHSSRNPNQQPHRSPITTSQTVVASPHHAPNHSCSPTELQGLQLGTTRRRTRRCQLRRIRGLPHQIP